MMNMKKEELVEEFKKYNLPSYRVNQIWTWIYNKGVKDFDCMLNLSKETRHLLKQYYEIDFGTVTKDTLSEDGTRKFLIKFGSHQVESVFIPETLRGTICVSSQVGCSLSCSFCHTGTQKIARNLTAGEIVSQVLQAKHLMYDFTPTGKIVSNIVFMGQGEPFYNYTNVREAIKILLDQNGLSFSKRRITVSTSGVVPNIKKLGTEFTGISLAISLHAVTNELRSQLVPANKQWPLEELIEACKNFPGLGPFNRITFEYVMLKDVNDSDEMAHKLADLLTGFPALVNLIPFNPWPGTIYETSSNNRIRRFAEIISEKGIEAPIRWPRGRDISAACGQLKTESEKEKEKNISI
uniref:Radical SAM core domain-containing protein n=1 Tax=Arcella intermedia TaxID=1963864 RepID=A0A6B2L7U6_9EUKA